MLRKERIIKNLNFICVACLIFLIFVIRKKTNDMQDTCLHAFQLEFNERRFLGIYLSIFLIGIFPILLKLYKVYYVTKFTTKWRIMEIIFCEIISFAVVFSMLSAFGWFLVIGIHLEGTSFSEGIRITTYYFIKIFLGWVEIGMVECVAYILLRNLFLAFIFCDGMMILMNLSIYMIKNEKLIRYLRLFDFMYAYRIEDNLFREFSIGLYHTAIICMLFIIAYEIVKRQDIIMKGINR